MQQAAATLLHPRAPPPPRRQIGAAEAEVVKAPEQDFGELPQSEEAIALEVSSREDAPDGGAAGDNTPAADEPSWDDLDLMSNRAHAFYKAKFIYSFILSASPLINITNRDYII